ncbi:imidazole glycerol phosphate synthase subunit HisH [Eggerthellaceae bacterium zg-893]|nr:imidazole glycerol phosphate synthase subunit HisH [Eggerthellaceae bacterium zg-893]
MIAVVDYHKGNLLSVQRGLEALGARVLVTDDAAVIARADAIVLPGVGAFADAAGSMRALGQLAAVRERIALGVPFLGICLGMHLMFEEGTEGAPQEDDEESSHNAQGLAVLPGVVDRMPRTDAQGRAYKVPHVGWNQVVPPAGDKDAAVFASPLFAGIDPGEFFYFTHSYVVPDGPFSIAETTHATAFPCAVQYGDAAFGVQFHPEKSSDAGSKLLGNFIAIAKGA